MGFVPEGKVRAGWKVPSPLPSSTETSPEFQLAAARSSLPSPLKSPTVTEVGRDPTAKVRPAGKVPSPLPSSTATLLEPSLATTRSGTPSPLKSPTATVIESLPTGKSLLANDSVWAGAGVGNSDQNTSVAATTNASLAEVLVISGTSRPTPTVVSKSRRGY